MIRITDSIILVTTLYPQTYEVLVRKSLTDKYLDFTSVHLSG